MEISKEVNEEHVGYSDSNITGEPNGEVLNEGRILLANSTNSDGQDSVELIQISSLNDLHNITGGARVWQLIPSNLRIGSDSVVLVDIPDGSRVKNLSGQLVQSKPAPADAPNWAKIINDCEKVGQYYRGWVATEQDLDVLLTFHKQQTQSMWGTRQSPTCNRPSARLMWKSQYVPFDGIPFINCGSRAVVMECQFGPRRRNAKPEKTAGAQTFIDFDYKHACPARIYIKKVRKFPEYAVHVDLDKKVLKQAMDKAFSGLKSNGFNCLSEDRYYIQLPLEKAHEYHSLEMRQITITKTFDLTPSSARGGTRLAEPVAAKIRELVASGIQHVTTVRKMLRKYVVKDLFNGEDVPVRHDLSYFPTVNDLQNHIHTALIDIENGTLPLREAAMDTLTVEHDHDWSVNWASNIGPHPETVTVTLTQDSESDIHTISKVETHMSDGTIKVSKTLTADTAALLARLHPTMFPNLQAMVDGDQQVDSEKITEIVHNILTKPGKDEKDFPETDTSSITGDMSENGDVIPPPDGVQLDLNLNVTSQEVTDVNIEGD